MNPYDEMMVEAYLAQLDDERDERAQYERDEPWEYDSRDEWEPDPEWLAEERWAS